MRYLIICCCLFMLPLVSLGMPATVTQEYKLNNGLKLIVREDHRAPVVFSSVWYKVGSSYEQYGTTGISHVLEHMMFRGTYRYGAGQLTKVVNENGGSQNAMTTNDFTVYYQLLPAEKLALSFQLESDRMHNLTLSQHDFSKEIQIVMEERRMNYEDNPQVMTWVLLNAAAHLNSPDQHPTIGWKSDLQHMTIGDVRNWYHHWYGPNNATIIVVGDVKADKVYQLAQHYFGNLPTLTLQKQKKFVAEPTVATREINVHLSAQLPMLMMAYNVPSSVTAKQHWQPYALMLLADILGSGDSSRLASGLVRQQHMAVLAMSNYNAFHIYDSLFTIVGVPAAGYSNAKLQQAIHSEIKQLQQHPVSQQELDQVKAQYIAQFVYDKDSLTQQAMQIGTAEMTGASWHDVDDLIARIQKITPAQIQKVAQEYLQANNLTIANLVPISKGESNASTSSTVH